MCVYFDPFMFSLSTFHKSKNTTFLFFLPWLLTAVAVVHQSKVGLVWPLPWQRGCGPSLVSGRAERRAAGREPRGRPPAVPRLQAAVCPGEGRERGPGGQSSSAGGRREEQLCSDRLQDQTLRSDQSLAQAHTHTHGRVKHPCFDCSDGPALSLDISQPAANPAALAMAILSSSDSISRSSSSHQVPLVIISQPLPGPITGRSSSPAPLPTAEQGDPEGAVDSTVDLVLELETISNQTEDSPSSTSVTSQPASDGGAGGATPTSGEDGAVRVSAAVSPKADSRSEGGVCVAGGAEDGRTSAGGAPTR